jgi:hypothetical protein
MNDEKLDLAIQVLEDFYFGESGDCGEKLFINFAKKYKQEFFNSKLSMSTENKFE